jgi:hypothetical protein
MSSLVHYRPTVNVIMQVYTDRQTSIEIDKVRSAMDAVSSLPQNVSIVVNQLPHAELFRRSIGRNMAAIQCETDVCWFTDADVLFGEGCLDAVVTAVNPDDPLCSPARLAKTVDRATADRMVERERSNPLPHMTSKEFSPPYKVKRAIGALQVVGGNIARQSGYLKDSRFARPVSTSKGFRRCFEDIRYRKQFTSAGRIRRIDVPNLCLIWHTFSGRNLDAQGKNVGRKAW